LLGTSNHVIMTVTFINITVNIRRIKEKFFSLECEFEKV